MRKFIANVLIICMIAVTITAVLPSAKPEPVNAQSGGEMRGIWVSVFDFSKLGLKTSSEKTFRNNVTAFLQDAEENGVNTVFFHVRAFDDAIYPSETFKRSSYISSTSSYDPLKILVEETHKQNMEFHAWMNPYRITYDYFLDPSLPQVTDRIVSAVKEVLEYGVDGIHFDDYFYNAAVGYKDTDNQVTLKKSGLPSAAQKRKNVNVMIKKVYSTVKAYDQNIRFGVSPQGNISNCMAIGADVKTWLSEDGYVDYAMPQIYWTDQWGASGTTKMFSERLEAWKTLNTNQTPMYVGLALYRTATVYKDDPGWKKKSTNLKEQVALMRDSGWSGYVLFSAADLSRDSAQEELNNLKDSLGAVTMPAPQVAVAYNGYDSLKVSWNRINGVTGYRIYQATAKEGSYKAIKTIKSPSTLEYSVTGLSTGKTYYYKVRAYLQNQAGKTEFGGFSQPASKATRPDAPVLKGKASDGKPQLSWNPVSGADGYVIYRAGAEGTYKRIKVITTSAQTKYSDGKLEKGSYQYKGKTFTTVSGKRIYSGGSQAMAITIK